MAACNANETDPCETVSEANEYCWRNGMFRSERFPAKMMPFRDGSDTLWNVTVFAAITYISPPKSRTMLGKLLVPSEENRIRQCTGSYQHCAGHIPSVYVREAARSIGCDARAIHRGRCFAQRSWWSWQELRRTHPALETKDPSTCCLVRGAGSIQIHNLAQVEKIPRMEQCDSMK